MSASLDRDLPIKKTEMFSEGGKVSVLSGGHAGKQGIIIRCTNSVQVQLNDGVHIHGPYTMFRST